LTALEPEIAQLAAKGCPTVEIDPKLLVAPMTGRLRDDSDQLTFLTAFARTHAPG